MVWSIRVQVVFCFWICFGNTLAAEQGLEVLFKDQRQTLLPIGFDTRDVVAFRRDGFMLHLKQSELKEPKVVPQFTPFTQQEMRAQLLREFGRNFEVTGTGNYLVVHPRGARDLWADRFEELYRSMVHFFRTRGLPMPKPKFPLVGIVFYSQQQYEQYCQRALKYSASGSYGVYIPRTNRIYLFDDTRGAGSGSPRWEENLATVMHEAAHQTAFNCGVHIRASDTPVWVAEGLGCLFESKGIYNAFKFRRQEARINQGRLQDYQRSVRDDADAIIASVVSSDTLFRRDPGRAYAVAWAMTFYFSEREPRKYISYLKLVSKRKPLTPFSRSSRVQEFTDLFGKDYQMLAVRMTRFLDDLPAAAPRGR